MKHRHSYFGGLQQSDDSTDRKRSLQILLIFSFLGILGNGLLLFYYGNWKTRTYRSRDAIYIRRMAFVDFLICIIVIPYTVLFEYNLINDDATCKTMEYIRHFFVYLSHLLLYTYAWELPQRHLFSTSKTYNKYTLMYSVFMAALGAIPTIFLFRVDEVINRQLLIPALSTRGNDTLTTNYNTGSTTISCHFVTYFSLGVEQYNIKSLTWMYVLIPIVVYSMSLYWFLMNLSNYISSAHTNQKDSIFLTNLEDVKLFKRLSSYASVGGNITLKASQRGSTLGVSDVILALTGPNPSLHIEEMKSEGAEKDEKAEGKVEEADNDDVDGSSVDHALTTSRKKSQAIATDVENLQTGSAIETPGKALSDISRSFSKVLLRVEASPEERPQPSDAKQEKQDNVKFLRDGLKSLIKRPSSGDAVKKKARFSDNITMVKMTRPSTQKVSERRGTKAITRNTGDSRATSSSVDYGEEDIVDTVPEVEFFDITDKSKLRPILKGAERNRPRLYPRVGSYKKSLATIIMCDLILIPVVMAIFLVTGRNSIVLNLVHIKSIFGFYVLSIINPHLRCSFYGREKCACFPPAKDEIDMGSMRASVLQVTFVRERRQERRERRRRQKMLQKLSNLDSDII